MEHIIEEFETAYPQVLEHLTTAYPDLNLIEQQIAVLNFLRFRSKEEADLLGLTESTIFKYRSNLKKEAGSDPISKLIAEEKTEKIHDYLLIIHTNFYLCNGSLTKLPEIRNEIVIDLI